MKIMYLLIWWFVVNVQFCFSHQNLGKMSVFQIKNDYTEPTFVLFYLTGIYVAFKVDNVRKLLLTDLRFLWSIGLFIEANEWFLTQGRDGKSVDKIINIHWLKWSRHILLYAQPPTSICENGLCRWTFEKLQEWTNKTFDHSIKLLIVVLCIVDTCKLPGWGPRIRW